MFEENHLKNAFDKYSSFKKHPFLFINALIDYNNIKKENGELDTKYNSMMFEPTNENKNDLRHIYTNAKFTQKYPEQLVRDLGNFKEDADLLDNKPLLDTQGDFINNEKGIAIGKKYPYVDDELLFDISRQEAGMPLSPRNNTLYGRITNY